MNSEPRLSIIVPVYNVEKYLERCIESIRSQTFTDYEVILVDDQSRDSCPAICDRYAQIDERFVVIHKTNEGLGLARNTGLNVAKGAYIAFVDSDDYLEANMYEELIKAAYQGEADIVFCGYNKVTSRGRVVPAPIVDKRTKLAGEKAIRACLLEMIGTKPKQKKDNCYGTSVWKAIYKSEIINEHTIRFCSEREFISEDMIFQIDYLQYAKLIVALPECFYNYCTNENSLTKSYKADRFKREVALYEEVLHKISQLVPQEGYDLRVKRLLLARARVAATELVRHKKQLGTKRVLKEMAAINEDEILRAILQEYPTYQLPMQQRLFFFCMKRKWVLLEYALIQLNMLRKGMPKDV